MIQEIKDRVPVNVLSNDAIRYGIYDEQGNLLRYEYIKREDEPTEIGTPVNRKLFSNIQGDLYTQYKYNEPVLVFDGTNYIYNLDLPLTSYEEGKIVNIKGVGTKVYEEVIKLGNILKELYNSNKLNILSSSYISSQFLARHAIDENFETYFKSGMETDPYLKVNFEEPQKITKMKLQFKVEDSGYFTSLSIQGSNDEDIWTNLYTTTEEFATLTEVTLENVDYYKHYRLQCKCGDIEYFYVWEWQASEYIGVELVDRDINVEPYININQLGVKKINGAVRYGEKISLVYNGESFDILYKIPKGIICMWSGSIDTIPIGWALCDGNNGTPNLLDRFIVGAGESYEVGDTGGSNTVKLTIEEMPAHTHSYSKTSYREQNKYDTTLGSYPSNSNQQTGSTGGDQPHENRPPYYALAYIMKI